MSNTVDTRPDRIDIWSIFELSAPDDAPVPAPAGKTKKVSVNPTKFQAIVGWIKWRFLELLGIFSWFYIILKLLFFDIDTYFFQPLLPSLAWLSAYKILLVLSGIFLISVFFWKWMTLLYLAYVFFYPFVLLCWKIPRLIYKSKLYNRWLFWMFIINGLVVFYRNLRYHVFSKSISLALLILLLLTQNKGIIIAIAGCLSCLLTVSLVKLIYNTFSPNMFFQSQLALLDLMKNKVLDVPIHKLTELTKVPTDKLVSVEEKAKLLRGQPRQSIGMQIQFGIIGNRILYLWASKLQQYREFQISMLFNMSSYFSVVFSSLITLSVINYAVLKYDVTQFGFEKYPTIISIALYSFCSFFLSEGGGMQAKGDISYFIRLVTGIYSLLFLTIFVSNLVITFKGARDDSQLKRIVANLRKKANEQENDFIRLLNVGMEEAFKRLTRLGMGGFMFIFDFIQRHTPTDDFSQE